MYCHCVVIVGTHPRCVRHIADILCAKKFASIITDADVPWVRPYKYDSNTIQIRFKFDSMLI